jgi:hypothetical protein
MEDVLLAWSQEGKEQPTYNKRSKANWIGHILCRNSPTKHVTEGKVDGRIVPPARGGRRCKQLVDAIKETRN